MNNDNLTQPIEECDDYRCERCQGIYTGSDWREVSGHLICPDCADKDDEAK